MRTTKARIWTHVVVVAGCGAALAAAGLSAWTPDRSDGPTRPEAAGPGQILLANHADAIPGSYVVVLRPDAVPSARVRPTATDLAAQFGGTLGFTYAAATRGFSVTMEPDRARQLAAHRSVAYVQQNLTYRTTGTQPDPPSWGLDRIDQPGATLDASYTYPNPGTGVHAYILDTGVRTTHQDLAGRATHGWDFVDDDADASDCHGHGTHVAGTVAGTAYGVAKEARIVGVRVLDCSGSGTTARVIAGVNWVTENAHRPAVANMSLGVKGSDRAIEDAVRSSIAAGVPYVVSAGNDHEDSCGYSPARVPAAVTVGATSKGDARAWFSNHGGCVDIFAPGEEIVSLGGTGDSALDTKSGTSMAAPHVAGVVALILAVDPDATPEQVTRTLLADATSGAVTDRGTGSPNRLLHTPTGAAPPAGSTPPSGSVPAGSAPALPGAPGAPGAPSTGCTQGIGGPLTCPRTP
jgi:subtilisin family serine protease